MQQLRGNTDIKRGGWIWGCFGLTNDVGEDDANVLLAGSHGQTRLAGELARKPT